MKNKQREEMNKAALVEYAKEQDKKIVGLAKTIGKLERELEQARKQNIENITEQDKRSSI